MKNIIYLILWAFLFQINSFASVIEVFQREYVFTNNINSDVVVTQGLVSCVSLVLYDDSSSELVMSHIDARVKLEESVELLISQMDNNSNIKAWIIGGINKSKLGISKKIIDKIREYKNINIIEIITNESSFDSISVSFSLLTGVLSIKDVPISETPYYIRSAKIDRLKFSSRLFRHEKSLGGGNVVESKENNSKAFFDLGM